MPLHRSSAAPVRPARTTLACRAVAALVLLSAGPSPAHAKAASSSSLFSLSSAAPATLDALISQYGLDQTFAFPQPADELGASDAAKFLKDDWSLNRNQIQAGQKYLSFAADPFDATNDGETVLEVDYERGSYGGSGDGGAQFYAQPLNGSSAALSTMLLQYEVAFSGAFAFSQGGKLPGLRGGPDPKGCSGGNEADGLSCFSARLMWRTGGAGEVYAYIPTTGYGLCSSSDVTCNSDYGTSLSRGSFTFGAGRWNPVALFVQLNSPATVANGRVFLYANGSLVLAHDNLQLRASDDIASVGGLFFSTFFGGSDSTWASPKNQSTFYRNFSLRGGSAVSDGAGTTVGLSAGARTAGLPSAAVAAVGALGLAALALL